jgi:NCAIR mutase (PurE)-related protein
VVNIDNGYGAGHQAALINSRIVGKGQDQQHDQR